MKDSSPLFTTLAILAILAGTVVLIGAEGAIHEIEALILFLIAAVLISGAGVVKAVNGLRRNLANGKKD